MAEWHYFGTGLGALLLRAMEREGRGAGGFGDDLADEPEGYWD